MSKISTLIKLFKNPRKFIRVLGDKGLFNWLSDKPYLKLVYWAETGKKLNLSDPKTYNEKLQWLKIYDRKEEYVKYADKYAVRKYIAETIGEEYLIPLIDVYNNVDEIDWDALPKKFVLKCTHGSGSNIICKDKEKLDTNLAEKKLKKWMNKNWYWFGREWVYKNIEPKIICEEFLNMNNYNVPVDYKIMCFNGKPKLIQVHKNRFRNSYTKDFYNIQWEKTNIKLGVPNSNNYTDKPKFFNKMLNISKILSKNIPYVRIDLYQTDNSIYFGEMTFYPTSGFANFSNYEHDKLLGDWIKLPINKMKGI